MQIADNFLYKKYQSTNMTLKSLLKIQKSNDNKVIKKNQAIFDFF